MDGDTHSYFARAGEFERHEVPDGYVIYDQAGEHVHFLNLTAAAILELCDGRSDAEAIADVLRDSFDLPSAPLDAVEACLASLVSQGLVEPCSRSSSAA